MSLEERHVVIIGGTSGIGLALAEAALAQGAKVTVGSSQQESVDKALRHLKSAMGHVIDLNDDASVEAFFGSVGDFDHLVSTAGDWGGARNISLETLDIGAANGLFDVRFWGVLRAVKFAHKQIREGGSVTLTNGMVAHKPSKGSFVSTAMAGAIEHLTRALAFELQPIRVNCVCPGLIRTDIWQFIPEDKREARFQQMTSRLPLERIGETEETTAAYIYLLNGGYTTGQVIKVDGGASII